MKKSLATLWMVALAVGTMSCGSEAPSLPPADSMEFLSPQKGTPATALTAGSTANVEQAAGAVGLVAGAVNLYLLVPRLVFAAVINEKPQRQGDAWVWQHTFPLAGWDAALHGSKADRVEVSMHITGLHDNNNYVQDFVWYSGSHGATEGTWQIFDPGTKDAPGPAGGVLRIDWSKTSDTQRGVTFTNVCSSCPKLDDQLDFALDGSVASMSLHDAHAGANDDGAPQDFSVVWNKDAGSGVLTRTSGERLCWDTLANGQVDMACPSEWPLP